MTRSPSALAHPHVVEALLADGWRYQPCPSMRAAAGLFDRLRELAPHLVIQRRMGGRVVETTLTVDPAPG